MRSRLLLHIGFWLTYLILNSVAETLFPSSSDKTYSTVEIFLRYLGMESIFLPWQMIPFYALFYYILPLNKNKDILKAVGQISLVFIVCMLCYRSLISPVSMLFYGDGPEYNTYSLTRMFYTFMELLPGFALASSVKLYRNKMYSDQRESELNKQKQEVEIQLLKSQFNPHFLFNTLNNLYGLSKKNNPNTPDYILKLSNIMRYILEECKSDFVPLQSEITLLENYIELEKIRYDDRLTIVFDKEIIFHQSISPLLLITFIENAFKHGAGEQAGRSFIHIKLLADQHHIYFKIENSTNNAAWTENNGLRNVKKQLSLVYADKHSLSITSKDNVFDCTLNIYP